MLEEEPIRWQSSERVGPMTAKHVVSSVVGGFRDIVKSVQSGRLGTAARFELIDNQTDQEPFSGMFH